jgi:membrane associated rhomboid family serine protease
LTSGGADANLAVLETQLKHARDERLVLCGFAAVSGIVGLVGAVSQGDTVSKVLGAFSVIFGVAFLWQIRAESEKIKVVNAKIAKLRPPVASAQKNQTDVVALIAAIAGVITALSGLITAIKK